MCVDGVGLLMDYLEGVLAAGQRGAIDAHLATCPRCVAFIKSYRETPRIFRDATAAGMPAGLSDRLRLFLKERRP